MKIALLTGLLLIPAILHSQIPEKQISFAQESKPHSYYVEQAKLWWKEIEKDKNNENSWYNYFRANRNAQGTADWSEEFIKESPYLKLGPDIVKLMKESIPDTFTYNYVVWTERGFDPTKGSYLLKAYNMNPDFEGIHATMITYAESVLDFEKRKEVNKKWFERNEMSPGLLNYGYNVLMSLEADAIIFTQHDNDTYPLWMIQDVKNIRPDVTVLSFDMLLVKSYRDKVFEKHNVKELEDEFYESNPYNLEAVLTHILSNYMGDRPIYVGLTVTPNYYRIHKDKMYVSGLALKYTKSPVDLASFNAYLVDNLFHLDYLSIQLTSDKNQNNVNSQNRNYLKCFDISYNYYISQNQHSKAERIENFAISITKNSKYIGQDRFKNLDTYLQGLENGDSFSGIVVIAKNGETLFRKTIGFADRENRVKINLDTQFELSSTSKLFTGTCVVKLIQEGKVKVNDKIGKYIPELKYGDKVTIHHLLTHSSGYADVYNVEGFTYTKVRNCSDIIPFIRDQNLLFSPGDSVYYSESGMMILGALIEKVSGISYQDYVTENILDPLGMTHTSFINDVDATESNDGQGLYAEKYIKSENNEIVRQTFDEEARVFIPLAAGGIWSSASDLIKFDEGIHNYKIMEKEFVELMTKQYTYTGWPGCYFGYIWNIINSGKNEAVGHGGNSRGHHSNFFHFKKDGTVMIVLTNYGFVDIFEVSDEVEKILYN